MGKKQTNTFDLNRLFEDRAHTKNDLILLRKILHNWQKTVGLFATRKTDGGLKSNQEVSVKNLAAYKFKEGSFYLCFEGMLKYDSNDVFSSGDLAILRVKENYNNFIVFEKLIINEKGNAKIYTESFLKFDIIAHPKYVVDDRGALYNAIDQTILSMPDIEDVVKSYKKQYGIK